MTKPLKKIAFSVAAALLAASAATPASAQLGLGVGVDTDVDVRVGTAPPPRSEVHRHYSYDGYRSGEWHPRGHSMRRHHWDARYNGYDCYESFRYDWEDGERVRYESTFCYDEYDRPREQRGTRIVVRID